MMWSHNSSNMAMRGELELKGETKSCLTESPSHMMDVTVTGCHSRDNWKDVKTWRRKSAMQPKGDCSSSECDIDSLSDMNILRHTNTTGCPPQNLHTCTIWSDNGYILIYVCALTQQTLCPINVTLSHFKKQLHHC